MHGNMRGGFVCKNEKFFYPIKCCQCSPYSMCIQEYNMVFYAQKVYVRNFRFIVLTFILRINFFLLLQTSNDDVEEEKSFPPCGHV